jgi:hypothetical protein
MIEQRGHGRLIEPLPRGNASYQTIQRQTSIGYVSEVELIIVSVLRLSQDSPITLSIFIPLILAISSLLLETILEEARVECSHKHGNIINGIQSIHIIKYRE